MAGSGASGGAAASSAPPPAQLKLSLPQSLSPSDATLPANERLCRSGIVRAISGISSSCSEPKPPNDTGSGLEGSEHTAPGDAGPSERGDSMKERGGGAWEEEGRRDRGRRSGGSEESRIVGHEMSIGEEGEDGEARRESAATGADIKDEEVGGRRGWGSPTVWRKSCVTSGKARGAAARRTMEEKRGLSAAGRKRWSFSATRIMAGGGGGAVGGGEGEGEGEGSD